MKRFINRFLHDESGVTALETAIILIAFVVVAAVFAFTMLTTGTFMTERSKEAAYSGLAQVRGSMELKGSVLAYYGGTAGTTDGVSFTVANVAGGEPIDFTPPDGGTIAACAGTSTTGDNTPTTPTAPGGNVVNISYKDAAQQILIQSWTVCYIGYSNSNNMLEERELFRVFVPFDDLTTALDVNTPFSVEIKPPSGAVLVLQRLTPPTLETVMDLK